MNALGREIRLDEVVIIDRKKLLPQYQADPRFQVKGGFGRLHITTGSAIMGIWLATGEQERFDGSDIDADATRQFQETGIIPPMASPHNL